MINKKIEDSKVANMVNVVNAVNALSPAGYAIPKWKRLTLPENLFPKMSGKVIEQLRVEGEGVQIENYDDANGQAFDMSEFGKTLGDPFTAYIDGETNHGYQITSRSMSADTPVVKIGYVLDDLLVDNHLFIAEAGSKLTVIMDYQGDEASSEKRQHYGTTRLVAKRGSQMRLVKIQRFNDRDDHFDQVLAVVEEGASLELVDIQFGSNIKAIAYETHLKGRRAKANLQSLYFGESGSQLDLSFTMRHYGENSESTILSKGALSGDSKKTFRGNLIFETGSMTSVGREKEVVVLLDPEVKSDSIPALLCSEDDVIGEHAASVGQLDQDKIFYLMSRGLSLDEAKKMVIKASFEEVLMALGDEPLKASIEGALDRRLAGGV